MDADLVVVGAGAAGMFAAIRARSLAPRARIVVLEAAARPLQKVKISGGGRCNVTHACFDLARLLEHYPRGHRELRPLLSRFGPRDTMEWFESRGVRLKTEADGRVFPVTDNSQTIIDCLLKEARDVELLCKTPVTRIEPGYRVYSKDRAWKTPRVLLATGGNPLGWAWLQELGHTIVPPVPSLFTLTIDEATFKELAGISVEHVKATVFSQQEGPLLFTHWGVSGPAILKLSAWDARELHQCGYKAKLRLDLVPALNQEQIARKLKDFKREQKRKGLGNDSPLPLPRRLWKTLTGVDERAWGETPDKALNRLAERCKRLELNIVAKGQFKEEFVTAGGVPHNEVDLRTMESRKIPKLYLAGEVLNVDGLTGGFNFQNAWAGGWVAGESLLPAK